jgi:hypothetical protein
MVFLVLGLLLSTLFSSLGPVVPPPPWRGRGAQGSLMRKSEHESQIGQTPTTIGVSCGFGVTDKKSPARAGLS